jgi:uncharacterized protein (TIGR03067 family)
MLSPHLAMACLIPCLALTGSARGDDPAPAGDLTRLEGIWTTKGAENPILSVVLDFKGNKVAFKGKFNGQEFEYTGEIKVDDKASPKTLDWTKLASPGGDDLEDLHSIYKLEGDTLTLCSGGPGSDRPTEFKAGDGSPQTLTVFTRKKADPTKDDAPKGDLAKLQGNWKALTGPNKDRPVTMEVKGKAIAAKLTGEDGEVTSLKGDLAVNDSAKPPTIDFNNFKNGQGEDVRDILGIYRLEGDTLTICVGNPGETRPTEFKAGEDNGGHRLLTFTRSK